VVILTKTKEKKNKSSPIPFIAYFPWAFLIIMLVIAFYYPITEGTIVARVNSEPITLEEIDALYNHLSPEEQAVFTKAFLLNATINERLMLQAAVADGVIIGDKALEDSVEAYLKELRFSKEKYTILLENKGITYEDFVEDYKNQLIISAFITFRITNNLDVSDEEAREFYNANKGLYTAPKQVKAGHILLEARSDAEDALDQLDGGADFTDLAKENSIDPSAQANGGILEFATKDIFVPEFSNYVFEMGQGDIGIVETQFGFHVVKLVDTKPQKVTSFEEAKKDIKGRLMASKQGTALQFLIGQLRKEAQIEIIGKK
jgi:parvulin-like peptidyl-prolyl isomerase